MTAELVPAAPADPGWRDDVVLDELLRRAAKGDESAFMEFFDATRHLAWRLELRRWRDRSTAATATCRRFVSAWTRVEAYPSSGLSPRAWLLSVPTRQAR